MKKSFSSSKLLSFFFVFELEARTGRIDRQADGQTDGEDTYCDHVHQVGCIISVRRTATADEVLSSAQLIAPVA